MPQHYAEPAGAGARSDEYVTVAIQIQVGGRPLRVFKADRRNQMWGSGGGGHMARAMGCERNT